MADPMFDLHVSVRGGLFNRNVPESVRRAVVEEAVDKVGARLVRKGSMGSGGRGLGVRRKHNQPIRQIRRDALVVETISPRGRAHWPRLKGTTWLRKNARIAKAMGPRVLRKTAERIVAEMGGR